MDRGQKADVRPQTEEDGREEDSGAERQEDRRSFLGRNGPYLLLGALVVYVVLLGIGTLAELTHNDKILSWWIFK